MNRLLSQNLAALSARGIDFTDSLDSADGYAFEFQTTNSGSLTAAYRESDGKLVQVVSRFSPEKEATRFVDSIFGESVRMFILIGCGAFHPVRELLARMRKDASLIVIEPLIAILRGAFERLDLRGALSDERLHLLLDSGDRSLEDGLTNVFQSISRSSVRVVVHPGTARIIGTRENEIRKTISRAIERVRRAAPPGGRFIRRMRRNQIENALRAISLPFVSALRGAIAGKAAVAIGAGPSLDHDLAALSEHGDRAYIVCADSAVKPLLDAGIVPDLICSLDIVPDKIARFENLRELDETPVVLMDSSNPGFFDVFRGPKFVASHGNEFSKKIDEIAGISRAVLHNLFTAGNMCVVVANYLGASRIAITGLDFSFSGNSFHAAGHGNETWKTRSDNPVLEAVSVTGKNVNTFANLMASKQRLLEQIAELEAEVFDSRVSGLTLDEVRRLELAKFLESEPPVRKVNFAELARQQKAESGRASDALRKFASSKLQRDEHLREKASKLAWDLRDIAERIRLGTADDGTKRRVQKAANACTLEIDSKMKSDRLFAEGLAHTDILTSEEFIRTKTGLAGSRTSRLHDLGLLVASTVLLETACLLKCEIHGLRTLLGSFAPGTLAPGADL
ncbi:MAG: DUF115 domain-containing protein [Planctomycetes bacterium]|nr:DUF115 domain-containing protein [Planctomycetota bacterium]